MMATAELVVPVIFPMVRARTLEALGIVAFVAFIELTQIDTDDGTLDLALGRLITSEG